MEETRSLGSKPESLEWGYWGLPALPTSVLARAWRGNLGKTLGY